MMWPVRRGRMRRTASLVPVRTPWTLMSMIRIVVASSSSAKSPRGMIPALLIEHVDRAEAVLDAVEEGGEGLALGDVERQADGLAADLAGDLLGQLGVEVADRDLGALADEGFGGGAADASGAAGDGDHLAVDGTWLLLGHGGGSLSGADEFGWLAKRYRLAGSIGSDRAPRRGVPMAVTVVLSRDPARHAGQGLRHVRAVDREGRRPDGVLGRARPPTWASPTPSSSSSRPCRRTSSRACAQLLDAFHAQGFNDLPQEAREQMLHAFADDSPETLAGVHALQGLTLLLFYAMPDARSRDQPELGGDRLPGPALRAARRAQDDLRDPPARRRPGDRGRRRDRRLGRRRRRDRGRARRRRARRSCVLEMGGYYNEADFNQLELWAYENLYRGGGITQTDDGSIALMAGSNLGGGTTVNWTNCLRTKPWVREQWETRVRARGPGGRRLRPPPRRGLRAHQRQPELLGLERPAPAHQGGLREARLRLRGDHPQRRPDDLRRRAAPATWASATSRAPSWAR